MQPVPITCVTLQEIGNLEDRTDSKRCSVRADRRRRGKRERRVQEIVNAVQTVMEQTVLLDLLPKSEIEIYLQILQADGAEKAACVNAAMLAIANAGMF